MSNLIGYLGPNGTFTELAAQCFFPNDQLQPYPTIVGCMEAALEGKIDFAVVPLENTIEGSVPITIDYLFHDNALPIIAEMIMPIQQHLMVHPLHASKWAEVSTIYSHPHAISQCYRYLRKFMPHAQTSSSSSTAAAAEWVKDHPEEQCAAIGNELAAKTNGLTIVQRNIHDYPNNHTRFIVLHTGNKPLSKSKMNYLHDKTTFMITLPSDYPGALHKVLSAFSWRNLNLSKIESRPMKTGLGQYFFIIDVEQGTDEVLIPGVKAELEALGCGVTILGSYPCYAYAESTNGTKETEKI
jgi:prephenate dehydratase